MIHKLSRWLVKVGDEVYHSFSTEKAAWKYAFHLESGRWFDQHGNEVSPPTINVERITIEDASEE